MMHLKHSSYLLLGISWRLLGFSKCHFLFHEECFYCLRNTYIMARQRGVQAQVC